MTREEAMMAMIQGKRVRHNKDPEGCYLVFAKYFSRFERFSRDEGDPIEPICDLLPDDGYEIFILKRPRIFNFFADKEALESIVRNGGGSVFLQEDQEPGMEKLEITLDVEILK